MQYAAVLLAAVAATASAKAIPSQPVSAHPVEPTGNYPSATVPPLERIYPTLLSLSKNDENEECYVNVKTPNCNGRSARVGVYDSKLGGCVRKSCLSSPQVESLLSPDNRRPQRPREPRLWRSSDLQGLCCPVVQPQVVRHPGRGGSRGPGELLLLQRNQRNHPGQLQLDCSSGRHSRHLVWLQHHRHLLARKRHRHGPQQLLEACENRFGSPGCHSFRWDSPTLSPVDRRFLHCTILLESSRIRV